MTGPSEPFPWLQRTVITFLPDHLKYFELLENNAQGASMRRRGKRLGKRGITIPARRGTILPAPGFLPMEYGAEVMLSPVGAKLDHIPQQLINRPMRPGSGTLRVRLNSSTTIWLRAANGPAVN